MYFKISKQTISEYKAIFKKEIDACVQKAYAWYEQRFDNLTYDCDRECYNISTSVYDRDKLVGMVKDRYRMLKNQLNNTYDSYCAELDTLKEEFEFFMSVLDFTTFDSSNLGTRTYIDFSNWTIEHKRESDVNPKQYVFHVVNRDIPRWDKTCRFSQATIRFDKFE